MTRMFVRHQVEDFDHWKKVYDDFDQAGMGVRNDAVFQAAEDPNDVTVWHDFDDLESARALAESDELRDAMKRGGVVGEPAVWFTEPA